MKPLMILNPSSQGGKTGRRAGALREAVERRIGAIDVAATERPRHAVELAEQAALDERDSVLAVGGDGTIHECVNGLMAAREQGELSTRLGVIGQGTGGDLRRTLGIEHDLDAYLNAIADGHRRALDVGKFSYVDHDGRPAKAYFINILSMGMGGLVDQYVATLGKALPGVAAYFVAIFGALVQSKVGELVCTVHEAGEQREERLSSRNLAVCNGRYFGSGMEVGPMAVPDDGHLDVVSLPARSRAGFALFSSSIYSGKHVEAPDVKVLRCERIEIDLDNDAVRDKFLLDVDGEPLGKLPIDIELEPKAVEFFVPAP